MDLGIAGATAVVTGGSKGMGRAVAEVLAGEGARIAVMARAAARRSTRPSPHCAPPGARMPPPSAST